MLLVVFVVLSLVLCCVCGFVDGVDCVVAVGVGVGVVVL